MTDYNIVDFYYDFQDETMPLSSDGKMTLVRGSYAVAQQVQFNLTMQQTSWYLQQDLGIPWFADNYNFENLNTTSLQIASEYSNGILGSPYDAGTISSIIQLSLTNVPGVTRIYKFSINEFGGDIRISASIITESGSINGIGTADIAYLEYKTLQSNLNNVYNIGLSASKSKINVMCKNKL